MWWVYSPQAGCRQNLNHKTYNLQKSIKFYLENIANSSLPCCSITHLPANVFNAISFSMFPNLLRTTRHQRLHRGGARRNPILNPLFFVHHETLQAPQTVAEEPSPPIPFPSAPPRTTGSTARREKLHPQPLLLPHHQTPRDTTTRNRNPNTPHHSIPHQQTSQWKVAGTITIHTG